MNRRVLLFASLVFFGVTTSVIVSTSGADVVSHDETDVLELEPAGEGTYTQIDDDTGEIQIIISEENPNVNADGVNGDALTDVGPVFEIQNVLEQQRNATVWISHDSAAVEFYAPGEGQIESQKTGAFLRPGDAETIAMRVDTRDTDEITLEAIQVVAVLDSDGEADHAEDGDDKLASADDDGEENDGDDESDSETPDGSETETGTETGTSTPNQSTSTPTPTVTDDETSEDDPGANEELAGLGGPSLLVLVVVLLGGVAGVLLLRRTGGA